MVLVLLLVLLLVSVFLPITFSLYLVKQMMMNLLLRVISVFGHQCRSHRHLLLLQE